MASPGTRMRVLLLSPLPGLDPANGDVTYTEQLLADPPADVEYVDYATALADGSLRERARASEVGRTSGLPRVGAVSRAAAAKAVNAARRREWLFREPLRFFEVDQDRYSLVHAHVFSIGFRGDWPPVVVSNSVAVDALYRDGLEWPQAGVRRRAGVERLLATALQVDNSTYHRHRATRFIAFTEHLRAWWVDQGIMPSEDVDVVPCSVPEQPLRPMRETPSRIGFFAGSPQVKGLDRAFAAFEVLRAGRPDLELVVAGAELTDEWAHVAAAPGVSWTGRMSRDELLGRVLPSLDVLAHPTRFDGLPLSVLEAMSVGVPIVSSDYRALPEVLGDAGLTCTTSGDLPALLGRALDPHRNCQLSFRAQKRQREVYSPRVTRPLLEESYRRAIAAPRAVATSRVTRGRPTGPG